MSISFSYYYELHFRPILPYSYTLILSKVFLNLLQRPPLCFGHYAPDKDQGHEHHYG